MILTQIGILGCFLRWSCGLTGNPWFGTSRWSTLSPTRMWPPRAEAQGQRLYWRKRRKPQSIPAWVRIICLLLCDIEKYSFWNVLSNSWIPYNPKRKPRAFIVSKGGFGGRLFRGAFISGGFLFRTNHWHKVTFSDQIFNQNRKQQNDSNHLK